MCFVCAEKGRSDKVGTLTCRECKAVAHRTCLHLKEWSFVSNSFVCCFCDAWRAWHGGTRARLAAQKVSVTITALEAEQWEEGTVETYHYRLNAVRKWAAAAGFAEEDVFPSSRGLGMASLVALGVLAHGASCWAPAYLEGVATAVGAWHRDKGVPNPMDDPRAVGVLKGAKKRALRLGHKGRGPKAPVSKELLDMYLGWLRLEKARAARQGAQAVSIFQRDAAWVTLGFHALLRRSELMGLRVGDVALEEGEHRVRVFIRQSKTDPGRGATVWLSWSTRTGIEVGRILSEWIEARRAAGARDGDPLFTAWDKARRVMTDKGFASKDALSVQFRRHLVRMDKALALGLDVRLYAAHSLRRGGANAMKEAGAAPVQIQEHGRWSSECYRRYLERTAEERLQLTAGM